MATNTIHSGMIGVDYAAPVDIAALAAAGAKFVCRYISIPADSWKVITPDEIAQLRSHDIGILLNWEAGNMPWQQGASTGSHHGAAAAAAAHGLGYPTTLPIIVSIDANVAADQIPAATAYLQEFDRACGEYPIGVYGGAPIANSIGATATFVWATDATAYGTDFQVPVNLQQRLPSHYPQFSSFRNSKGRPTIDVDIALTDLTVWDGTGSPAPSHTSSYTVVAGDTMTSIARKFGVSLPDLIGANLQIANPDLIKPGETINVPASGA